MNHNIKLFIQKEKHGTETFILDGIDGRSKQKMATAGWTWTAGPDGGCYTTKDITVFNHAKQTFK